MTLTDLEVAILGFMRKIYCKEYIGKINVSKLPEDVGYKLTPFGG